MDGRARSADNAGAVCWSGRVRVVSAGEAAERGTRSKMDGERHYNTNYASRLLACVLD